MIRWITPSLFLLLLLLASPAGAVDKKISDLPAASSATAADLYECSQSATSNKCSGDQLKTFVQSNATGLGRIVAATPSADQNDYAPTDWNDATNKGTTLAIAPTKTERVWQLTGLAGGVDGRIATILNTSTDYLFILNHENASSTAANRLNNGAGTVFLLPGESATYLYQSSRWRIWGNRSNFADGLLSPHRGAFYFEEFAGRVTSATAGVVGIMSTSATGTGGAVATSVTDVTSARKAFGSVSMAMGTTTTGRAGVGTNPAIVPTLGPAFSLNRLSVGTLSDGTNTYRLTCGIADAYDSSAEPTDGIYWEYDSPTSTAWRVTVSGASTRTKQTVTGFTVATATMYDLGVWANSNWSRVDWFYSTDGLAWTVPALGVTDANIPINTEITGLGCKALKSAGTTSASIFVDFMSFVMPYAK